MNFGRTEWLKLRDILKCKIDKVLFSFQRNIRPLLTLPFCLQNIASFLADAEKLKESRTQLPSFSSAPSTSGGLKLPPFEARERDESNPNEAPKAILEEGETKAAKQYLYAQIDSFDGSVFSGCMSNSRIIDILPTIAVPRSQYNGCVISVFVHESTTNMSANTSVL